MSQQFIGKLKHYDNIILIFRMNKRAIDKFHRHNTSTVFSPLRPAGLIENLF